MKIGLLGFGVVGKGVYDLLQGSQCQITKVLCRRELSLPDAQVTHDFADILQDGTIDTVVEVMGGLHPALEYVQDAIRAGKHIVTANKALIAAYYDELIPLAEKMGVSLRCTAAVGGGIGWLSNLERAKRCQKIETISGIMNGTCNYILDSMTRLGLSYGDALKQAQKLGYAEADPTADVEGFDTWNKLIISANIAFGVSLDSALVPVTGISRIQAEDVEHFKAHGLVCKLMATATENSAYVQPTLIPQGQPEAAVPSNYNHISLIGSATGKQSFYGQGAGRYPTAYNVVQDCADILAGTGFYCAAGEKRQVTNKTKLRYYIRGGKALPCNVLEHWGDAVVTEPVSINAIHAWLKENPHAFIAALAEM